MTKRQYKARTHEAGQQLLALRNHTGLTQTELGQLIGVSRRSILKWEGGEGVPNGMHLQLLLEVFVGRKAFTTSQEVAEAGALWDEVSQAATRRLGQFNTRWFEQLLSDQASRRPEVPSAIPSDEAGLSDHAGLQAHSRPNAQPPPLVAPPAVDWGEAIDVPVLYGREAELARLQQWVLHDRCRVVALLGLGGIGKTSLALRFAQQSLPHFDVVVFRSLQNAPPLAEVLDDTIRAVSHEQATPPNPVPGKITLLVQLLRERRCLVILDNLESLMQSGTLTGTYADGYAEYGALLQAIGTRLHQSCLLLTSREKPAELGALEGRAGPVRTLALTGLDDDACQIILEAKDIVGPPSVVGVLARLYSGNPLALTLVAEPIRELFGGDVGAFLSAGDAFFNGVGMLLHEQFARSTPLEQVILYWLALERELVSLNALLINIGDGVSQRAVLVALESLRRRMLIERTSEPPMFTLQPVIMEYVTDYLIEAVCQEVVAGQPRLLCSHLLIQATAKEYLRRSQERLIVMPLLERLGSTDAAERVLLNLLGFWRGQPLDTQGYGPGNVINLRRLLRGHARGLDLSSLAIRQVYLQGVEAQDTSLAGASVRDCVFTEAFGIIHAVAVSADGAYWAASSINGTIQVWRDDGRTTHLAIAAHAKQVITLAFSPDGQTLASGSYDCTIKLWDMTNGALIRTLEGHTDYVQSIAFAPDGHLLVSGSDDRTLRLWDVASGACLWTLDAHTDNAYGVAWSPDGSTVASCSFDLLLRVWDVASGVCVQTLAGHTRPVCKLTFAPDGQLLASGGFDCAVKIWNVANGQCLQTFAGHSSAIKAIAWSPDGRIIASASYDATIRLWERQRATAEHVLFGHAASVNSIAFTADGSRLISGSDDHTVRVWDIASGWCVRVIEGYGLFFFAVVWSPDGQRLLSANSNATLTVWRVADGAVLHTLHGHTHTVYAAGWSPNGQWLASGGYDQSIRIWEAARGVCVRIIQEHADIVYRTVWSPDGRWLASVSRDQTVRIWNTATGACRWVGSAHTDPINEVVWSPDGERLASCSEDRTVRLWRAADGALLQTLFGHERSVAGITWSPNGQQIASCGGGGATGEVFIWDADTGVRLRSFIGHASIVFRVVWSLDGKLLLSGGMTGNIRWWDAASGVCLHARQGHQGWIRSLSISPDGSTLVSSGEDGVIQLWNVQTAESIRTLHIDRPYERLDITGIRGLTEAQKLTLHTLGAGDLLTDG